MLEIVLPILFVSLPFVVYCVWDCYKQENTRYMNKWLWIVFCCLNIPLGGILYLLFGKE